MGDHTVDLAGEFGTEPRVELHARQENAERWTLVGALDEDIWNATGTSEQDKLITRWCRDAGLNKDAARRIRFRLMAASYEQDVRPFGLADEEAGNG